MKQNVAIKLAFLSKDYEIHHEKPTLVEKFVKGKAETFCALSDINITIKRGEKVGIIGTNGSGKTTLLKILAGITSPTSGSIYTHGKIISLIDLEAGFHADLTGIQNIYLNGMLLGLSKKYIQQNISSIINFADIKQFIDVPLFTYSSGMKLRLGFSVAIHANPEILILDESIAVGDIEFKKKSLKKIREFVSMKKTVIIASHWMDFLEQTCSRIILLKAGRIKKDGSVQLIEAYKKGDI